jgi:hypothetical protein
MNIHEIIESENWGKLITKIEKISALVLLFGFVLFALKVNKVKPNILFIVGFSILAVIYFFYGFKKLKTSLALSSSFFRIYGWGLSISCISCMFTIMKWPINEYSLIISMILVIFAGLLGFIFKNSGNKNTIDNFYYIRLVIALIVLCFIYFKASNII